MAAERRQNDSGPDVQRRGRGIARVSARVITGVAGLAIAALCVSAAVLIPLPRHVTSAPSVTVVPTPAPQQRVCPGPLLSLAADSSDATKASSFGSASRVAATVPGTAVAAGDRSSTPAESALKAPGDGSAERYGAPSLLTVPPDAAAQHPPLIAGSQSQTAGLDDLTGLAVAGCGEASGDSWLVAGSTSLGETTLVRLSNPTGVAATVDLVVYGTNGIVKAPAAAGIIVAPGTQLTVPLAGLAPDLQSPVIHVESRGGRVLASLQQSVVRGLEPGGVELAGPTDAAMNRQVIAGVTVSSLATLQAGTGSESYAESLPAVRVLVPGTKPSRVSVSAVREGSAGGAAGSAAGSASAGSTIRGSTVTGSTVTVSTVTVKPGIPTEIPLDTLSDGSYTVTLTADHPIVAAARTSTVGTSGKDFSWFVASRPFTGDFLASIADGPGPVLHLSNTAKADATLTLIPVHPGAPAGTGAAKTVAIAAGSAVSVPVTAGSTYRVTKVGAIVAAVSYAGDGAASAFALNPPSALADPLTVYP